MRIVVKLLWDFVFISMNGNGILSNITINEQIQNIAQKKDTLCRRMYN